MDVQETEFTYRMKWFPLFLILSIGGLFSYFFFIEALNYPGYIKLKSSVVTGSMGHFKVWSFFALGVFMLWIGIASITLRILGFSKLTIRNNHLTMPVGIPYPKTKTYDLSKLISASLATMMSTIFVNIILSDSKFGIASSNFESHEEFLRFVALIDERLESRK